MAHGFIALSFWDQMRYTVGAEATAAPRLEQAVGLCREADQPAFFPRIATALGAASILGGRVVDAVPLLTQARDQSIVQGRRHSENFCSLSLAEAQVLAGRLQEAHTLAERVLALACQLQARGQQAYALRLLGEIAAQGEPPDVVQAETHFQPALTLAEELGMRPLVAHCHLGLGTLYAKRDQRESAHTELSTAIDLYRAMEMTFWLPQAEAALAWITWR